jgi:hypothetical protein
MSIYVSIDSVKEKAMQALIEERDVALSGKEAIRNKLLDSTNKYNLLKEELEDIDRDLINAMNNSGNINTIGNNRSMKSKPTPSNLINPNQQQQFQHQFQQQKQQNQDNLNIPILLNQQSRESYNITNKSNNKGNNKFNNKINNKINNKTNGDLHHNANSHQSYENKTEDSIDYTENILEQQVQQLSNFLQEDKLKLRDQNNRSKQRFLNDFNNIKPRKR